MVFQNHKSRFFRVRRGVSQGSVLGPVLFYLLSMIFHLLRFFPPTALFNADNLAIWSFFSSVPAAVEATQGALIRLERWSEYWCLSLNPNKCEAFFFSVDPHQAHLQSNLFLFNSPLSFNFTPPFLVVTFDRTISFSKHVSSLKAKVFLHLKAIRCIFTFPWGPSKESLSLLGKAFFGSSLMLYPDGFLS